MPDGKTSTTTDTIQITHIDLDNNTTTPIIIEEDNAQMVEAVSGKNPTLSEMIMMSFDGSPACSSQDYVMDGDYLDRFSLSLLRPNSTISEVPPLPNDKPPSTILPSSAPEPIPPAFIFDFPPKSKRTKSKSASASHNVSTQFLHYPKFEPVFSDREHESLKFPSVK